MFINLHTLTACDECWLTSLIQLLYFSVIAICSSCKKKGRASKENFKCECKCVEMHDENMQQINYHCRPLIGFPTARDWFAPVEWKCNCIVKKIQLLAMANKSLLKIKRETHCKGKKTLIFLSVLSFGRERESERASCFSASFSSITYMNDL